MDLFKPGARVLGVTESFSLSPPVSFMGGAVVRRSMIVDQLFIERITVGGSDSTDALIRGYRGLHRTDVAAVMVNGCLLSMYNVLDIDRVHEETGLPVVCMTDKKGKALEEEFERRGQREKLEVYRRLGGSIRVQTGEFEVWVRLRGIDLKDAQALLRHYTITGRVPEPIRVAKQVARAALLLEVQKAK